MSQGAAFGTSVVRQQVSVAPAGRGAAAGRAGAGPGRSEFFERRVFFIDVGSGYSFKSAGEEPTVRHAQNTSIPTESRGDGRTHTRYPGVLPRPHVK